MDDQAFLLESDKALQALFERLTDASDDYAFEPDLNSGALTVEFEDSPSKFVVSPNRPVHQIWVSANTKSFKLDWDEAHAEFVLPTTGQTLIALMEEALGKHLGLEVQL
jgi:iron-sulfur cluster assembly protein CyaY